MKIIGGFRFLLWNKHNTCMTNISSSDVSMHFCDLNQTGYGSIIHKPQIEQPSAGVGCKSSAGEVEY